MTGEVTTNDNKKFEHPAAFGWRFVATCNCLTPFGRRAISVTLTLDTASSGVTITPMPPTEISIKELHGATGEIVRRAGASRIPLVITDHGEPVAILANPNVVSQARPRRNSLLPEFAEFLKRGTRTDVQSDLDDVRGDR